MLEHAELSIQQAGQLANCDALNKTTSDFSVKQEISEIINQHWQDNNLPSDRKRLISNFSNVLKLLDKEPIFLREILDEALATAPHPNNLSPYSTFIQYLIWRHPDLLKSFSKKNYPKGQIFIDPNLEIPSGLDLTKMSRFINL